MLRPAFRRVNQIDPNVSFHLIQYQMLNVFLPLIQDGLPIPIIENDEPGRCSTAPTCSQTRPDARPQVLGRCASCTSLP